MPYVQRNNAGKVVGVFALKQPGYATERLADNHPDLIAFLNPPDAALTAASAAVQQHLDATARARRYDSIHTAIGYRGDPNPVFAAEAEALFVWRSQVWTAALAILADVEAGTRPAPDEETLIAELPAMVWPDA